jgi:hypothetical protein
MTTYYVATLAKYVLVEAENEKQARELGRLGLEKLHAEVGRRIGKDLPVNISCRATGHNGRDRILPLGRRDARARQQGAPHLASFATARLKDSDPGASRQGWTAGHPQLRVGASLLAWQNRNVPAVFCASSKRRYCRSATSSFDKVFACRCPSCNTWTAEV